jgi:uncharacterized BrkB/YihY/UPF0761 family membrane protein
MSTQEYLGFALFFGFYILWIIITYMGTKAPEKLLNTSWGKYIRRKTSVKQFQRICLLFLIVGIIFLGFALLQLYDGTFQLKGSSKTYSFSDFFK